MCGHANCDSAERRRGADLGLYSVTFNSDATRDRVTFDAYRAYRVEAEGVGFRHFLEVFPPHVHDDDPGDMPRFLNDFIVRALAGVVHADRPVFLRIPYFGPGPMDQLAAYDSSLVVGILGGTAGTAMDAFHMLWEARKYGRGPLSMDARSTIQNTNFPSPSICDSLPTARPTRSTR